MYKIQCLYFHLLFIFDEFLHAWLRDHLLSFTIAPLNTYREKPNIIYKKLDKLLLIKLNSI